MMNHLYLIRHGENIANLTLEFSHRKVDYSLTDKGRLQAQQTAAFFAGKDIHEIYASPLKRTMETAQIIAEPLGLVVTPLEAFREINVGDLEGQKPTAALWKQHNTIMDAWRDGHPEMSFPGGEDYPTLVKRLRAGFECILAGKEGRNMIVVGYGGIFSFVMRDVFSGFDRTQLTGIIGNCSITELETHLVEGRLETRLICFSATDHLNGEAAKLVSGLMDLENSKD